MAEDTKELVARIQALSREEAMEAALALGQELEGEAGADTNGFVEAVEAAPLRHIEQTEELARVTLVVAAADPGLAVTVSEILDNVGAKAFILGGAEIIALAALGVAALRVVLSRGRESESRTTTLKYDEQGNVTEVVIEEQTSYGVSTDLGAVVAGAAQQGQA